jgi:hypothetical protein
MPGFRLVDVAVDGFDLRPSFAAFARLTRARMRGTVLFALVHFFGGCPSYIEIAID